MRKVAERGILNDTKIYFLKKNAGRTEDQVTLTKLLDDC